MKSLKVNFALNSANQLLSIIVPLVTTPYLSRILGAESLGIFSYANSVAYYFTMFAMLGLANYGGREIARVRENREKLSNVFSGIYSTQLIVSSVVIIIYLTYMLFDKGIMSKIYLFSVIAVSFDINWLFYGLEEFSITLKRNCTVKMISTILIFLFVKNPSGVYHYATIMVGSTLLGNGVLWLSIKGRVQFIKPTYKDIFKHLKSNLVLFLPILLTSVYRVMDKIMLKWMSGYEQVGFYENADKFGQVPLFLISSLSQVMIPRISFLLSERKEEGITSYLDKSIQLISLLSTTVIFGIVGVSRELVPIYFGKGFNSCIALICVILPSYILTGYASTFRSQLLIPYGKDKEFSLSLLVGAACNISLNLLLIPRYGAMGAAIATCFTEGVVFAITVFVSRKAISWKALVENNIKYYVCGTIMLALIICKNIEALPIWQLVAKICLGAIVYVILLSLFLVRDKRKTGKFL